MEILKKRKDRFEKNQKKINIASESNKCKKNYQQYKINKELKLLEKEKVI